MPWPYRRNIAQEFDFPLFDADGDLVNESGTITTQVAIDGQSFLNVSGSVNQYGTTGVYKFSGQAPDWNGARLTFKVTSSIVKPTVLTFHTDSKQFADIPSLADLKAQAENAMTAFSPMKSSVSGRFLDVSAGGEAGLDWANIGSPGTIVSLGGTTIRGSGMITDVVTGAVGSVTGNVGGNVVGSVGSVGQSGISPAAMGADVREQIASDVIKRGMVRDETAFENRSLGWAISKLVNKIDLNAAGDTLTIRRTNDLTALFTQSISTSGGAAPIISVDTV